MSSCALLKPTNGFYLTRKDFEQWQDYFSNLVLSSEEKRELGCNIDPDLKSKNITFVVTERCNLACTYCYETHKSGKKMTWETAQAAVDFLLKEEKTNGYFSSKSSPGVILEFIGGEPLLEIDLIDRIVEYFKFKSFELNHPWATNYMISLTTNGVLFRDDKVQNFLKRNPGRVSIGLTIDGNKALHDTCRVFPNGSGSYDVVEKSVQKWIEVDSKPQTKMTLSPFNISHLFEATKNLYNLGLKSAFTNFVFEEGWTVEHAKIAYQQMKLLADWLLETGNYARFYTSLFDEIIGQPLLEDRNWCGGNGKMLAIGTDGRCFPCIRFMKYSLSTPGREEQPVGDIYKGLDKKEENEWLKRLNTITMSSQSGEKCNACQIAFGCSLCTGYNYDKFGDPNHRATFICLMHQARVLANRYYWQKLYTKLDLNKEFALLIPKDWALKIIDEEEYDRLLKL